MSAEKTFRGPRVHRPASSATWEHEHRWGPGFGDSTTLRVTRTDRGSMTVRYGSEALEIRGDLVAIFAEMVDHAAAWNDTPPTDHAAAPTSERGA